LESAALSGVRWFGGARRAEVVRAEDRGLLRARPRSATG
jgi:hypothetical protein